MKKGWKIFWITAGAVGGIGLLLCGVALAMGLTFYDLREAYPNGIGLIRNEYWEEHVEKRVKSSIKESIDYAYSGSGITGLELNLAGCDVIMEDSSDGQVHIDTDYVSFGDSGIEIQAEEEDGKLIIQTVKNGELWSKITGSNTYYGTLYIYLPSDLKFSTAEISFGAGELYIKKLDAEELYINVGAGEFEVENFQADEVTVNVGAGDIEMYGDFQREFNLKCGIGEAEINLRGRQYDYNYTLKSGVGDINIGNEEYSGLANARTVDNGGDKDMDIICGAGEVNIEFEQ